MSISEDTIDLARAARSARARPRVDSGRLDRVMPIREWCELNGFCLSTGQRMLKRGEGPQIVQLSPRRMGIRVSDNARWQEERLRTYSPGAA